MADHLWVAVVPLDDLVQLRLALGDSFQRPGPLEVDRDEGLTTTGTVLARGVTSVTAWGGCSSRQTWRTR